MENQPEQFQSEAYNKSLKGKAAVIARIDKGQLPMLKIAGSLFFARVAFGILTPGEDAGIGPIRIGDLEMDPETKKLNFFYHVPTRSRVSIPDDIKEYPPDVVRVQIPNMYFLDPVGMAKKEGKEPRYYLTGGYLEQRMYRKARIIPLEKTELESLVRKNREKENNIITSHPKPCCPYRHKGKSKGL